MKASWDTTYLAYYEKYIEPKIDCCGWWSATRVEWNGRTDLSIWTSNQEEAVNRQLQERLDFRSTTIVGVCRNFNNWHTKAY